MKRKKKLLNKMQTNFINYISLQKYKKKIRNERKSFFLNKKKLLAIKLNK